MDNEMFINTGLQPGAIAKDSKTVSTVLFGRKAVETARLQFAGLHLAQSGC
jgi:hypothetical protein